MSVWLLVIYVLLIMGSSLTGGLLPLLVRFTHARMQLTVSFVAGVMLGVGLLHMLPHALRVTHEISSTMVWVLAGFLIMFFVQRFLYVHSHLVPEESAAPDGHRHEPGHVHDCQQHDLITEPFTWSGAAAGLAIHSLISGLALAAAYESQRRHVGWAGAATFLAIFIHKPFDSLTIVTLMAAGGWRRSICHLINGLFSLAIPAGVLIFYAGFASFGGAQTYWLGYALALSAGTFLCIAASDLLPEMQFHSHDRGELSMSLLAGVALAYLMQYVAV